MIDNSDTRSDRVMYALLGAASIGCISGLIVPNWWIEWLEGQNSHAVLGLVLACLVVALAGPVVAARILGAAHVGAIVVVIDIAVATAVFLTTFLFVAPSCFVGAWLVVSGVAFRMLQPTLRRSLVRTGAIVVVLSLLASSGVLLNFPLGSSVLPVAVNTVVVGIVARSALKYRNRLQ